MDDTRPAREAISVGDRFEAVIGAIAHGGHCIAHHAGRTFLVRHCLPGERVVVAVTGVSSKVCRGDAVEVLEASPDRVQPACPYAHPGGCGGCDFQHVDLAAQRRFKQQVITDAFRRFAGIDVPPEVQPLRPDDDGLHWRTRIDWHVDPKGRIGLHPHRSHDIVPIAQCPIAAPGIDAWRRSVMDAPETNHIRTVQGSDGEVTVLADGRHEEGPRRVRQHVGDRSWHLSPNGFWQVHELAARTLVEAALALAEPRPGQRWWDLYAGAGLFAAFLGEAVGQTGTVLAVEGHPGSVRDARGALKDLPQVRMIHRDVSLWLRKPEEGAVVGVVLDPPRTGAGEQVVTAIAKARPARIVYVACDPVALARDVALFAAAGYELGGLQAFDAFPMTHHVECAALLTPA